jgi:hypothetical protein
MFSKEETSFYSRRLGSLTAATQVPESDKHETVTAVSS